MVTWRALKLLPPMFVLAVLLPAAGPETEAFSLMKAQEEAWNRGDLDGFLESYENSSTITFVGAGVSRGFDALVRRYRRAYGDRSRMGRLHFSELEFHPLGENYAFLIGRFHLKRAEEGGGDADGRFTVVLRKSAAGWKIIHDHTSGG